MTLKPNYYLESKPSIKRFFKISNQGPVVDLSESYNLVNGKPCCDSFASEIYKVSFISHGEDCAKKHDLYLCYNELIDEEDITNLQESMGIEIYGDGSNFEVVNYSSDFSILFEQENSIFIDTTNVTNGLLQFKKQP